MKCRKKSAYQTQLSFRTEWNEERNLLIGGEILPFIQNNIYELSFRTEWNEERNLLIELRFLHFIKNDI